MQQDNFVPGHVNPNAPIDNADKKTFIQWIIGKGWPYYTLEAFMYLFYFVSTAVGIASYVNGSMDGVNLIILLVILNAMFFVNLYKTYQNYQDDKAGITR